MYERLNYAISTCSSIDGDGMMNEQSGINANQEQENDSDDDD